MDYPCETWGQSFAGETPIRSLAREKCARIVLLSKAANKETEGVVATPFRALACVSAWTEMQNCPVATTHQPPLRPPERGGQATREISPQPPLPGLANLSKVRFWRGRADQPRCGC